MARRKRTSKVLPTIWQVSGPLWERIEPVLNELDPPAKTGRHRIAARPALDGVIYHLRTGCQWNVLPKEFGDDSSVHRTYQRWLRQRRLRSGLGHADGRMRGTGRRRLAVASRRWGHGQGPFCGGEIGPNPTDRGKKGTKRSVFVEADGGPLAVVVAGANVHDSKLLDATLEAIVVERPEPTPKNPRTCVWTRATTIPPAGKRPRTALQPHIRRIGEEKRNPKKRQRYPARRWVVERTLAWLSKCRAILVRTAKKPWDYLGLLKLACVLLWYRRLHRLKRLLR